jgi:hypothetical protein
MVNNPNFKFIKIYYPEFVILLRENYINNNYLNFNTKFHHLQKKINSFLNNFNNNNFKLLIQKFKHNI